MVASCWRVLDVRVLHLPQHCAYPEKWDAQYRDKGLTIIGVHTPESDLERNGDVYGAKLQDWASRIL
jgi:hypothetical protein